MVKTLSAIVIVTAFALSAQSALAQLISDDIPNTYAVPDAGSPTALLATAALGLTGCRFWMKKRR